MMCVRTEFPAWLKKRLPAESRSGEVRELLADLHLNTVCQSARCPNLPECFGKGTATFMILGDVCTRRCRFCAVKQGEPLPPDPDEPGRVAAAAAKLRLRHCVVTSVTRDDLPDGGAEQFARVVSAIREVSKAAVEVLTPDFRGDREAVLRVAAARPDIYNHNVETVERLYPEVRPEADLQRSLELLALVASTGLVTKSGFMVGLGETREEVTELLQKLRSAGCTIVTIGQYLRPSPGRKPIVRFVPPEEFDEYRLEGLRMGFRAVASGPFVRSSYNAAEVFATLGTTQVGHVAEV